MTTLTFMVNSQEPLYRRGLQGRRASFRPNKPICVVWPYPHHLERNGGLISHQNLTMGNIILTESDHESEVSEVPSLVFSY